MKKTIITFAIVLGMSLVSFGQNSQRGGGLFQKGDMPHDRTAGVEVPMLPNSYGNGQDQEANTPLCGGVLVLTALGAAYAISRKRREE